MEKIRKAEPVKLPEPTPLTDAEYIDNMRTVLNAVLDELPNAPETVKRMRNDEVAVVLHSQGVGLIASVDLDLMGVAMEELMSEIDEALGDDE